MKRLLIDSHIFFWAMTGDSQLSKHAMQLIQTTPLVFISTLSLLELKALEAKGKIVLPPNFQKRITDEGFQVLDYSLRQAMAYEILNKENLDPFDNALLTAAVIEHCGFLTYDHKIVALQKHYPWIIDGRA